MARTVWLALICLVAVSVLFAVRTSIGARVIPMGTASLADAAAATAPAIDDAPPLAKADRLPFRRFPAAPSKTTVSTIANAPTPEAEKIGPKAGASGSGTKSEELTSWHWHVGSKITKR
jgi:hypothetical protein